MVALIAKHKHLMSKWTRRGGGNAHKQTRFFSPQRSCYGTHLWALLSLERVLIFRRGWIYIAASLPMMLVAVQVPMQCLLAMHCCSQLAMHCIGFQNGRRHADENVWDHELATSDPLKILETPLYVGSKQTRTKFSHKWRSNEWKQEFAQVYRTYRYVRTYEYCTRIPGIYVLYVPPYWPVRTPSTCISLCARKKRAWFRL